MTTLTQIERIIHTDKAKFSYEYEIIICPTCKGTGCIINHVLTNYHNNEYDIEEKPCSACDTKGRMKYYRVDVKIPL